MKNFYPVLFSVCILVCSTITFAQNQKIPLNEPDRNKPRLFNDLPDRINFDPVNYVTLFQLKVGQQATIPLSAGVNFIGEVVSKADEPNVSSVVIRSTNRTGARLTFTRVVNDDKTVKYIGRIISLQHGDSYEISYENNQYFFKKKGLYDLVNE